MENKELKIQIQESIFKKLEIMSRGANLSSARLCSLLIKSFIENDGKVFTGEWEEGPGIRILPDWPRFSSGVMKVKVEEQNE